MTDIAPPYDKALVEATTYEKKRFFLPMFAVHHIGAGQMIIRGKTFTDCIIDGPAVLAAVDNCEFDGCSMGATRDPKNLLLQGLGDKITGAIAFAETRFVNCKFNGIGFTGHPDFLASFDNLSRMSETQPG